MKRRPKTGRWCAPVLSALLVALAIASLQVSPARADFTDTRTDWDNFFTSDGYIIPYTYMGAPIRDEEGTSDSSRDTPPTPTCLDLASGSPTGYEPGPYETPFYGYYNGGTPYDEDDPATIEDDYVMFRMRIASDPTAKDGFVAYHWNVLLDVDRDGYKEYWIDLYGPYTSSSGYDQLRLLYNNDSTQQIADPAGALVEEFQATNTPDFLDPPANSQPGYSHTRAFATGDGTGDWWIDIQVPMVAFTDLLGNQVLFPDSPVGFVFSTGASNQNPLQKDWMMDLDFLSLADPINFGDPVKSNGEPDIFFADEGLYPTDYYTVGDEIYLYVHHPFANTGSSTLETITVTVTNPATGDDEQVTLVESGPNTGIFTNRGGAGIPSPSDPSNGWMSFITTSSTAQYDETWTATYDSASGTWIIEGSTSGTQTAAATAGTPYTSDNGEVSFTIYEDSPADGDTITFDVRAADPLPTSTASGADNDGNLQTISGQTIQFSYTTTDSETYTDEAVMIGDGDPFIQFSRANGLPTTDFQLTTDPATSDPLYVTVYHSLSNTNPAVAETITVSLTGSDSETITLTETGPDTGVFRNITGLQTKVSDGTVTGGDSLWEDIDAGVVTATFTYDGTPYDTTTSLFFINEAGRVYFTNGAGTQGVDQYAVDEPVFIRVDDPTFTCGGTMTVTVTSVSGDSETLSLYETAAGSQVYMNRVNDLVTTVSSAVVTSASSTFQTAGVLAGDTFVIATGPDAGTYTVQTVDSQTQLTLDTSLSATRTGIGFTAAPLMTATYDGLASADGILEAADDDLLTVTYTDCSDGDLDPNNDDKTDTAVYNAPPIVINEVFFYPQAPADQTASVPGQTEYIQLYNASASPVNITNYTIQDEDGFSYTIPQLGGSDIMLGAGEKVYILLYGSGHVSPFNYYDGSSTYYLFANSDGFPSHQFADPDSGDPQNPLGTDYADQVTLYNASSTVVDYVGWSATLGPSIDFLSDDSPAVTQALWTDDAYKNVTTITSGYSISRVVDGYDTDQPSDWVYQSTTTLWDPLGPVVTQVMIASLDSYLQEGSVVVRWSTASQNATVGFNLLRWDAAAARYRPVNRGLVPAIPDAPEGAVYRLADPGAPTREPSTYLVEEVEAGGGLRTYGPFAVSPGTGDGISLHSSGRRADRHPAAPAAARRLEALRREPARGVSTGDGDVAAAKVFVDATGLYRLEAADLAAVLGISAERVSRLIKEGGLNLTVGGRKVAYLPVSRASALLFLGQAPEGPFSARNVYLVSRGNGRTMKRVGGGEPSDVLPGRSFGERLHVEEDRWGLPGLFHDPLADYWFWDYVVAEDETEGARTLLLKVVGVAPGPGSARLVLHLQGLTATSTDPDHHAAVSLNGIKLGDCYFDGEEGRDFFFDVPLSALREGDNLLTVTGLLDTGAPYSLFFIDSVDLDYPRLYRASENRLFFPAEGNSTLAVDGFSSPEVLVFDVTRPRLPRVVRGTVVRRWGDSYRVTFIPRAPDRLYLAVTTGAVSPAGGLEPDRASDLRSSENAADYLIIAPPPLLQAAATLASHRRSQGLLSMVVNRDDVMDEFNHGLSDPRAVRDFLSHAYRTWARPPRYVLLAGNGTYDYKDHGGWGDNLLPPLMVPTPQGLFASDLRLGDTGDDAIPEMAVGRIPVMTAAEFDRVTAKIIAYESLPWGEWRDRVILLADNPDATADFPADSSLMASFLPPGREVQTIHLGDLTLGEARSRLAAGIQGGVSLVNYTGHGGLDRLAQEGLLLTGDVASLSPLSVSPVITALTCVAGRFDIPGYDSIGETLVAEPGGGAIAVFAPTGFSENDDALLLAEELLGSLPESGTTRLGDVILAGLAGYAPRALHPYMLSVYTLLGDPALRLR